MELVIKLDDETYKEVMDRTEFDTLSLGIKLIEAVQNGTVLPKGHGDLIDRRELKKEVYTTTEWNGDIHRIIYEASVDDAKPVVEADKEYEAEVITRGNCMMCGKELTEGLFICKECENKANSGK